MSTVNGTVEAISKKERGRGFAYGIKMNDGKWYGHGFKEPAFQKGDRVSFTVTMNGQYANIDLDSVEVHKAEPQQQAAASAPSHSGGYEDRQVSIVYQSSRKDALELVGLALQHDAVKLPAKQSDKFDALLALVDDVTTAYYTKVQQAAKNGGVFADELEQAIQRDDGGFDE